MKIQLGKTVIISALIISLVAPIFASAAFDKNLCYGMRDQQVQELQEFLTDQGIYSGPITGNFFALTQKAVKSFQTANGISSTGYFGPLTRAKANSLLSAVTDESGAVVSTTPPAPKTTDDVVTTLMQQVALLQQQLATLQTQQQKLDTQQQTLSQQATTLGAIQQEQKVQTGQLTQQTQAIQQIQTNTAPPPPPSPPQIIYVPVPAPVPPPMPPKDTTPPVFTSGPTAVVTLSGSGYRLERIDYTADESSTIIGNTCVSLQPRTTYNCVLKISDAIGNTSEKSYSFTTGPLALQISTRGLPTNGLSNEPAFTIYRAQFTAPWNSDDFKVKSLTFTLDKLNSSVNFKIGSLNFFLFTDSGFSNANNPFYSTELADFSGKTTLKADFSPFDVLSSTSKYLEVRADISGIPSNPGTSLKLCLIGVEISEPADAVAPISIGSENSGGYLCTYLSR